MRISLLNSAWDKNPVAREVSVEELFRGLNHFRVREDVARMEREAVETVDRCFKEGRELPWRNAKGLSQPEARSFARRYQKNRLKSWVPGTFNGQRSKANAIEVCCYVLDIEDGTTFENACKLYEGTVRLIHTTWNHTPENPRVRVVFPLAEPIPAAHWKDSWEYTGRQIKALGITPDEKCKDPSRIYFLPAVRSAESMRQARFFTRGDLLRMPIIPRRPPKVHYVIRKGGRDWRDPRVRLEIATRLGAAVDDGRAHHIRCPSCGRNDVYFFIEPERAYNAKCNHERSCGWSGPLNELVAATA